MANAYNNKVVLSNGTTIIDLSTDTVTDASHIMSGKVGHLADGSVVTGTGASESQVVSIEDVPNTTGTTAVITGVAAPEGSISITTNGTHDVYNYETAVVAVPSIDVPTFSSSDGVTITCDKTYAQCLAILNGGENRAFISFAGSNPDSLAGVNDLGVLKYYYVYSGALNARIQYRSNGSITISSVDTGQTLDVTSNGTYTASDDNAWARVNVNVPTGSATIQPLTVTSNGVYTAPSGVDGYSPVTVNVSGGGGAVSLLYTDTVTVSTTSTTAETVKTVTFSANNDEAGMFSSNGPLLCIIYDNAGLRDGYFSYSLNFIDPPNLTVRYFVHSRTAAGVGRTDSVNYGLYLSSYSSSASDGVRSYSAEISSRYSSTYSQTLDGTYTIKFFRIHLGLLPTS